MLLRHSIGAGNRLSVPSNLGEVLVVPTAITVTFNGDTSKTLEANGNATINVAGWGVGQAGAAGSVGAAGEGGHGGDYAAKLNLSVVSGDQFTFNIAGDYSTFDSIDPITTLMSASSGELSGASNIGDVVNIGGAGGDDALAIHGGGGGASGNSAAVGADGSPAGGGGPGAGGIGANGGGSGGIGGTSGGDPVGVTGSAPGGGGGGGAALGTNAGGAGGAGRIQITGTMMLPPGSDSDDAFTVT